MDNHSVWDKPQPEPQQDNKYKSQMQKAMSEGNIPKLLCLGFDKFMSLLFDGPTTFTTFLKQTGEFLDEMAAKKCKEEHKTYYGGKLFMELQEKAISLFAEMYFADDAGRWSKTTCQSHTTPAKFSDWEAAPALKKLREARRIEFPLDPPN